MISSSPLLSLKDIAFGQSDHNREITELSTKMLQSLLTIRQLLTGQTSSGLMSVQNSRRPKQSRDNKAKTSNQSPENIYYRLQQQLITLNQHCNVVFKTLIKPKLQLLPSSKHQITLLVKSYSAIINLKIMLSTFEPHTNGGSIQEDIKFLQKTITKSKSLLLNQPLTIPSRLTQLCINEIFNLNSIKEFELYNTNSNEQFKYDSQTQIDFLYMLALVKLSSHLKLFGFGKRTTEELGVVYSIYVEGKDTLTKLFSTIHIDKQGRRDEAHHKNQFDAKSRLIISKTQTISCYLEWVDTNWIPLLKQKIQDKSSSTTDQFPQIPIKHQSTYELFFLIHKLSELQYKYSKSNQITPADSKRISTLLVNARKVKILLDTYVHTMRKSQMVQKKILGPKSTVPSRDKKLFFIVQTTVKKLQGLINTAQKSNDKTSVDRLEEFLNHQSFRVILKQAEKDLSMGNIQNSNQPDEKLIVNPIKHQKIQNKTFSSGLSQKNLSVQDNELYEMQIPMSSGLKQRQTFNNESHNQPVIGQETLNESIKLEASKETFRRESLKATVPIQTSSVHNQSNKIVKLPTTILIDTLSKNLHTQTIPPQYSIYHKTEAPSKKLINYQPTIQTASIQPYLSKDLITPTKKTLIHTQQKSDFGDTQSKQNKKIVSVCTKGQFLTKFNFNNNSYGLKMVKLLTKNPSLVWADTKDDLKDDPSQQKFSKVYGLVYGDVTPKIQYHCVKSRSSKPIQPWRCFSLICASRTLDFYCSQNQYDIYFWLMGLGSYMSSELNMQVSYSRGKVLWKKCLMKLRYLYGPADVKSVKKDKKSKFYLGKSNARAIINFGKDLGKNQTNQSF